MLGLDLFPGTDQQRKVDHVLQLPGVARPAVALQHTLRTVADKWHGQVQTLAVYAQKIFGQRQDIPGPFAQGRQIQAPFAEVVIQPFVELAGTHRLRQINTGGRHQPHVDRARLVGAHASDFVGFQGCQQLDLNGQRQVADFVQIQRPAIGRAEPSGTAAGRAVVRTRGVTEQLCVGIGGADCPAVHRYEQPGAITGAVDVAGEQLLAAAGFATNQYRQGARCQLFKVVAKLTRARINEYQRFGANAQWAFFSVGKGQQRLTKGFMQAHGWLPPAADGWARALQKIHARRRAPCSMRVCRRYKKANPCSQRW